MQISEAFEEVTNNKFVQQFSALNIIYTDDDIQNWMSCDGPGYEHLDDQISVSLISGDYEKHSVKQCRKQMIF